MIPYGRQFLDDDDIQAVVEVLKGDWLTQGPHVPAFEEACARFCGASNGVALSSGTAALHAACSCLDLRPGDEVITSPITFLASVNAPFHCGGTPVFADVQPDTVNLSPEAFERAITPRTRAVIPVHFAGHPCDMDRINAIADRHGIRVIADAAHALGAMYKERKIGELAWMSALSFHPVKHITTGEGGMVLTGELTDRLRSFRHHATTKDPQLMSRNEGPWYYEMLEPGYNYRITDIQCALGLSQLKKAERFIARRRELASLYNRLLGESDLLRTPVERADCRSAYHLYVVRLDLDRLRITRGQVFEAMKEAGIGCQIHYIPVHLQPYYVQRLGVVSCPEAERYYQECLTLPLYFGLNDGEVHQVCEVLLQILEQGKA